MSDERKAEAGFALAHGSATYRCSVCGVTGTWESWKSGWNPKQHQCDSCVMDGKKMHLILVSPNDELYDGPSKT